MMKKRGTVIVALAILLFISSLHFATSALGGVITYTYNKNIFRVKAQEAATPENISTALNALSPGKYDSLLNVSPDGNWLVFETDRFDPECSSWHCLAIAKADLTSADAIRLPSSSDGFAHTGGFSAIASGGNLVVYQDEGGKNTWDLWAISSSNGVWGSPVLITGKSPYAYNSMPAISDDGAKVLYDCGNKPYQAAGTAICESSVDGTFFRVVLTPAGSPSGYPKTGELHQPDYAPDGSIVFEADWAGEQIWKLAAGSTMPVLINAGFHNDNSPCVLPDGKIISLWLDRPDGKGYHEIKMMDADGGNYVMALKDIDVIDNGIGCGNDPGAAASTSCSYSINPTHVSLTAKAAEGTITVTPYSTNPAGCSWTSAPDSSGTGWITITSGGSGTAGGTSKYSVSGNTTAETRTGHIIVGGQTFTIKQTGGTAKISASPASINFGKVKQGVSATKTVTVKNKGTATLDINEIKMSGTNSSEFTSSNSGCETIDPGKSCTISVFLTASSYNGKSATMSIASNGSTNPVTVRLSGNAAPPKIKATPASLNFSRIPVGTTSSGKQITITNTGTSDLDISSVQIPDSTEFVITDNACASLSSLPANTACKVTVAYTPSVTAKKSASLNIVSNDPTKATATVKLAGTGK